MDYKHRDYFLFRCSYYDYVYQTENLLTALFFNCKFHPPYNHFKYGEYDGRFINKYVTHMVSIPKNRTNEFIDFLSKRENVGEIVMKLNREVLKQ